MNLINFIRIIRSGELKAQKIDKEELPEFLYYVVKSEDINKICVLIFNIMVPMYALN